MDNVTQEEDEVESPANWHTSRDLAGFKVFDGLKKVVEGGAVVLTPKDQNILVVVILIKRYMLASLEAQSVDIKRRGLGTKELKKIGTWQNYFFSDLAWCSMKAPPEETAKDKGPAGEVSSSTKKKGRTVAITAEDMHKRKNDVKERTTLLLALPDEHQLRFSKYDSTKELCKAILKTFGGNEATKKTKKNQLKQQYGNFKAKGLETLEQTFNKMQAIVIHLEFMDVSIEKDDLNQKFLTSLAPEWLVGKSEVPTVQGASTASAQVPTVSTNVAAASLSYDRSFARKYRSSRSQDRWKRESYKKDTKVEEHIPKAMIAIDGIECDWSYMDEEDKASKIMLLWPMKKKNELEEVKKEKESIDFKIENFKNASKDLDRLLGSQKPDKDMKGVGFNEYCAIPPPPAQVYLPPKKDLSWMGLPEFVDETITNYTRPTPSIDVSKCVTQEEEERWKNNYPSFFEQGGSSGNVVPKPMIKFVKESGCPNATKVNNTKNARKPTMKYAEMYRNTRQSPRDSGYSRHMTDNISYPFEYEPFNRGYVSFGHERGKITGKGSIKTSKLEFENVYFMEELKDNLRLGHLNFKTMNKLVRSNLVKGLPSKSFKNDDSCVACLKGKQHKASCKFDAKGDEGYFVGYSLSSKTFRVFNKRTKKIEENFHVDFIENKSIEKGTGPDWLFNIDTLTNLMNYVPVVVAGTSSTNISGTKEDVHQDVKEKECPLRFIALPNWFHEAQMATSNEAAKKDDAIPDNISLQKEEQEVNRDKEVPASSQNSNSTASLKVSTNDSFELDSSSIVETEVPTISSPVPTDSIYVPLNRLEDFFRDSSNAVSLNEVEVDLSNMETAIQVGLTPTLRIYKDHPKKLKKIVDALKDTSWVEAKKQELLQFKIQNVWVLVDCPSVVRPIGTKWVLKTRKIKEALIKAIRLFLDYASYTGFSVYQMDVKSAFMYGTIDEEVYVMQPPGFQDPEFPHKVYKVQNAMYGLHQAPKAWYGTLSKYLLDNGFQRGLQVLQKKDGIFLLQDKYIGDIFKKFGYTDIRPGKTPMDRENPWGKDETDSDYDGDNQDRNSTTGGCQILGRRLISWQCKKQTIMSTSTTEAEYVAVASGYDNVADLLTKAFDMGRFQYLVTLHNTDFHQIVEFLEASHIRYALTIHPTVYVSHIRQFWSTARVETTDGEIKILAQVNGRLSIPMDDVYIAGKLATVEDFALLHEDKIYSESKTRVCYI
uniref:Reverse transcriptase Ty1/copia-type domain-containing protein n=1 Tax=Tanacetum cinerariifolium TaxID=118510 RepID=A0A6L2LDI0_TANCI|nr:hypothetical protein [Tanacetum cinerariifolium]